MSDARGERAKALAQETAQMVYDKCMEIIAIMDEKVQAEAFKSESTYGLCVRVKGRETPVVVPDLWINEWAVMCDGDKKFVVAKVGALSSWAVDNPAKRKMEKNLRSWLGSCIRRDWEKERANRPQATDSLKGYERRHGGA